ncbi:unnamed protein product [Ranitomeya imitator]|uniref:Vitellogenin n=1 Tax=Ranitomeya imitator TaxID=111125 RepID=A0ABN9MFP9_9NEOB|nr:unnamed protein product [Ranitomeya imitator]
MDECDGYQHVAERLPYIGNLRENKEIDLPLNPQVAAHEIQVDIVDDPKFVQLSHEPVVKEAFHTLIIQQPHVVYSMLDIVAMALQHKYPSEAHWPPNEKPWFTLKDCAWKLEVEDMKNAISASTYDDYMQVVVSVSVRDHIIKNAPAAYKHIMMTPIVNMTGKTIANTLEAIRQLGDLGDWGPKQKVIFPLKRSMTMSKVISILDPVLPRKVAGLVEQMKAMTSEQMVVYWELESGVVMGEH